MQSCPRIASLGWFEWELPVDRGLDLLTHPSMQQVRDLGFVTNIHAQWLAAAASLSCLSTLDLWGSVGCSSADLAPLVHARALRTLLVSEWHVECMSSIMRLTQLTTLYIIGPNLNGDNFLAFCTAMSGLEEMELQCWQQYDIESISSADLAAGFSSLRSLRFLTLDEAFEEKPLAPVLHLAPSLRYLTLKEIKPADRPSLLARLLQSAPLLRVELR